MKNNKSGFTLLETIVSLGIITFIIVVVANIQTIFTKGNVRTWQNFIDVNEASSNMRSFVKEVRNAQFSQSGAYPLSVLSDNEIVFYTDYDHDDTIERIHYTLSGNELTKGITEPSGFPVQYLLEDERTFSVATNVVNGEQPVFTYFDESYPVVTQPLEGSQRLSQTRIIRFFISVQADETKNDYTLESHAQIRILKDNL
jgi:type II secretory pathway pseudopilin PulG